MILDDLAKLWADGATLAEIERATGITKGVAIGLISRAREAGDARFASRPPEPNLKPKTARGSPATLGRPEHLSPATTGAPTLDDTGVTRTQSSNWQALADIPEPSGPRGLVDLGLRDCRWPVGQRDGNTRFATPRSSREPLPQAA